MIAHPIAITRTDTGATIRAVIAVRHVSIAIGVGTLVLTIVINDKRVAHYGYDLIATIEVRCDEPAVIAVVNVLEPLPIVPTTTMLIPIFLEPRFEHIVTA